MTQEKEAVRVRSIGMIAREIRRDWQNPYYAAVPYLNAMMELDKITDNIMHDNAEGIIRYFLSNAGKWRGETARRVKAELKAMVRY